MENDSSLKSTSQEIQQEKPLSHLANYRDLFDRLRDCVFLLDPDTFQIRDCNPATEELMGMTKSSLIDSQLSALVAPGMREAFEQILRISKRRYHPRTSNVICIFPSGNRVYVEVTICTLKLEDESVVLQVMLRDMSRQHEAEIKVQESMRELQALNQKLERLSVTDEMTGLSNFRHFMTRIQQEHDRAKRYGNEYSLLFCDLDHFKQYNDKHGHQAGDELLRELGKILRENCRSTDLPARYGGEEFVLLCPETGPAGIAVLAERIRKKIESHPFLHAAEQPLGCISVSVGTASFPDNASCFDEMIHTADEAAYLSKSKGRNRISSGSEVLAKKKAA